ncbi:MAG: S46 family peptidase [Bacteroidaceae bacterium]|nr:S46 family peptidase [Bacteroidaceae bacterium]
MKKLLLSLCMLAACIGAKADEGMWTLYNLPPAVYAQMKAEGFRMDYKDLYSGDLALKNTVVNFSGYCSGVVVSPNGLVFTNHHCGFEAIRSHSTVEHDYMLNGFYARSYEEELPNPDMFVAFMISQEDITPRLKALGIDNMNAQEEENLIDSLQQVLADSVKAIDPTYSVEIDPFFEGNSYYATVYQRFPDLRLVFTIPKSMGKFGGETDNWMWPRQTCDFSVFRIYADPKTNGPAQYSEQNVPYHPANWAPVSLDGYKDGDFAMTVGYPGSTQRYLSSYGIKEMRDAQNAPRAQVRGVKQEVMARHMKASEAVRIKYDSKYAESSNYWKNSIGMNKCIDSIGIIQQKAEYEAKLQQWMNETGLFKDQLDFNKLKSLYEQREGVTYLFTNLIESFWRTSEFGTRAIRALNANKLEGPTDNPKKQYFIFPDNSKEWDLDLDKDVLAAMLKNYKQQVDPQHLPDFYTTIEKKFKNNYKAYVDYLYNKSVLMKPGEKIYVNSKAFQKDPGYLFGKDLFTLLATTQIMLMGTQSEIEAQEKVLCAAKLRMEQDMPHYSDANFTMRLSYGQVGEYLLNGQPSGYYTTAESIIEKMNRAHENDEYFAEPIMHELLSADDYGIYADKESKKLQLCFLTNNDITGGNSGSPMFDGDGRLIGLAFDGNWDSLSSDINFDRELARCIGVDIRYVLYLMDKWGHADRLLKEINPQFKADMQVKK